jgi:hypothetical protein
MNKYINILEQINTLHTFKKHTNQLQERYDNNDYYNYIDECRKYKEILGPSGLMLYKINNRYVFLFQDYHIEPVKKCYTICSTDASKCIWIDNFLEKLLKLSPFCADVFFETVAFLQLPKSTDPSHIKISKENISNQINLFKYYISKRGLNSTRLTFADCLGPSKINCTNKVTRARIHNIEFRRFASYKYNLDSSFLDSIFSIPLGYIFKGFQNGKTTKESSDFIFNDSEDIDITKYDSNMKFYLDNLDKYNKILIYLLDNNMNMLSKTIITLFGKFDDQDVTNQIYGKFEGERIINGESWKNDFTPEKLKLHSPYPKLGKQFNQFDNKINVLLKKFILEEYNKKIKENINIIKLYRSELDYYITHDSIESIQILRGISKLLRNISLETGVAVFDAYTFARVLKSLFIYPDSPTIMMYAGGKHIENYIYFFNFLEKNKIITMEKIVSIGGYNNNVYDACINLNDYNEGWNTILDVLKGLGAEKHDCQIKEGIII